MMQGLLDPWQKAWRLARFELLTPRRAALRRAAWDVVWPLLVTGGVVLAFDLTDRGLGATPSERIWAAYFGVLTWTTLAAVLVRNVTILREHRELIRGLVFRCSILPVADTLARGLVFLPQLAVALTAWLATSGHAQGLPTLACLAVFLAGFFLALLALAWTASLAGAVAPALGALFPPLLVLLLVLSPVAYPEGAPWHGSLAALTHLNPLSLCVESLYGALGLRTGEPAAPLGLLAGALVTAAAARLLVTASYGRVPKVI